jgi:hypothetical protein
MPCREFPEGTHEPCPFCDAVGTLERFARSDWYVCTSCTRTLLMTDGRVTRRGTVGEPWQRTVAILAFCTLLVWPSVAPAEMPRLGMRVRACQSDDCSKRAGISFSQSASRHVVELQVARHPENRRLIVTLYCDGFIIDGPAEMPHEGESAFPVRTREYRHLPAGHYVATAVLTTATGQQIRAVPAEFTILQGLP